MGIISRRDQLSQDRSETEDSFLLATQELLAEGSPFVDMSVGRIAERAGHTRTAFYFYFRDKRDLLIAIMRRVAGTLLDEADVWWSGAGNPQDLRVALNDVVRTYDEHGPVMSAVVEASTYDSEVRGLWHEVVDRFIAATENRLVTNGKTREEAHAKAYLLVWMTERACYLHAIEPDGMSITELIEGLSDIWTSTIY